MNCIANEASHSWSCVTSNHLVLMEFEGTIDVNKHSIPLYVLLDKKRYTFTKFLKGR